MTGFLAYEVISLYDISKFDKMYWSLEELSSYEEMREVVVDA